MKKPIPTFESDGEAEAFVDRADLADYDLSGGHLIRFELRRKEKSASLSALHPHGDRECLAAGGAKSVSVILGGRV